MISFQFAGTSWVLRRKRCMAGQAERVEFAARARRRRRSRRPRRARTRSARRLDARAAPSDDGRPCRARGRCRGAACRRARRRRCRSRHDRGRRCAAHGTTSPLSISRVPRWRQTFQKTCARPSCRGSGSAACRSRHGRPPCWARAAAPTARSPAAAGRTMRLLGGEAGGVGVDRRASTRRRRRPRCFAARQLLGEGELARGRARASVGMSMRRECALCARARQAMQIGFPRGLQARYKAGMSELSMAAARRPRPGAAAAAGVQALFSKRRRSRRCSSASRRAFPTP